MTWHVFLSICTVAEALIRASAITRVRKRKRDGSEGTGQPDCWIVNRACWRWRPGIWHHLLANAATQSGVASWVTVYRTPGSDTSLSLWHGSGQKEARQACDARGMGIKFVRWGVLWLPGKEFGRTRDLKKKMLKEYISFETFYLLFIYFTSIVALMLM